MTKHILTISFAAVALGAAMASPGPTVARTMADAAEGRAVFDDKCAQCHNATSKAEKIGPGLQGLYKGGKLPASGKPANDANVRAKILNGGGGMPAFKGSLTDAQVASLVAYLRTL
ncbi:MAG: cytochrome c [Acidobacteria bacterium]|nr:cytochrome c [Acidobacteriota bacterium]